MRMWGCLLYTSDAADDSLRVDLELVWDPPWDKSMMSEAAKLELNL